LDATEAGSEIVEEEEGEDVYAVYNQHDDTPMAIPPTTPRTVSVFMIVRGPKVRSAFCLGKSDKTWKNELLEVRKKCI
jgi:hypothetical protein